MVSYEVILTENYVQIWVLAGISNLKLQCTFCCNQHRCPHQTHLSVILNKYAQRVKDIKMIREIAPIKCLLSRTMLSMTQCVRHVLQRASILTSNIPRRVSNTSEAGHSGRFKVDKRSWTKFSKRGLKSSSSLPLQHLWENKDTWYIFSVHYFSKQCSMIIN